MDYDKLKEKVYNYNTKHEEGFTWDEVEDLKKEFPNINKNKFDKALRGITCLLKDNKEVIVYHCDILTALKCGIENREILWYEWD